MPRGEERGDRVAEPRPGRHQRDAELAGDLRPGVGHVHRRGLVADVHDGDAGIDARIVDRHDLVSGQAEDAPHAGLHESMDKQLGAVHRSRDSSGWRRRTIPQLAARMSHTPNRTGDAHLLVAVPTRAGQGRIFAARYSSTSASSRSSLSAQPWKPNARALFVLRICVPGPFEGGVEVAPVRHLRQGARRKAVPFADPLPDRFPALHHDREAQRAHAAAGHAERFGDARPEAAPPENVAVGDVERLIRARGLGRHPGHRPRQQLDRGPPGPGLRYAPSGPGEVERAAELAADRRIRAEWTRRRLRAMSGEKCSRVFGRDADQVQDRPLERRRSRSSWS